jgi:hypothetical protein
MKYIFVGLVLVHTAIHLMGFAKAFHFGGNLPLSTAISKPMGIAWLLAFSLLTSTLILFFRGHPYWWMFAAIAAILSQVLIFTVWKDAKFGSIANLVLILAAVAGFFMHRFEQQYRADVIKHMAVHSAKAETMIGETDLAPLPPPVQKYLRHVGVVGKPRVHNVFIRFNGEMRDKGKGWFSFTTEQYNFLEPDARLFYMKAKMFGITVPGYHNYQYNQAGMDVKLFGLIPLVSHHEAEMFKTETVTFLNDICLFAPAALVSPRFSWENADSLSATIVFRTGNITVKASLQFNEKGELVNFISDDRMAIGEMKTYRFSTPVGEYKKLNDYILPTYGEAIWHYPDGLFTYGKFYTREVRYNEAMR